MSIAALKYVSDLLASLSIPYAFMEWKEKPPEGSNPKEYRYFVGEYIEDTMTTREEDGRQDSTLILRGFTRGDWLLLEQDKETIERNAMKTAVLPDGTGIAVFYDGASVVPTGDAELKSIKINLNIQEWKVY